MPFCTRTWNVRFVVVFSFCLAVIACAGPPKEAAPLSPPCYAADTAFGVDTSKASQRKLPPSNVFNLYSYPKEMLYKHVEGRVLVRLHIAQSGKIDSGEFLRIEAPPALEAAACNLLKRLQFDASAPDFDTIRSESFVFTIRYCLVNCNRVPQYAGTHDFTLTGTPLPVR
jgi:TonB family protein